MAEVVIETRRGPALMGAPVHFRTGTIGAAQKFGAVPMPSLAWSPEIGLATAHLYERVKAIIPPNEWPFHAPYVHAINVLKKERNAVILAP